MKCKVCGCEFDSDRAHCPKCGSKAQEEIKTQNTEEFSWNTYDFPKPQSVSNIDMSWPSMNSYSGDSVTVMSKDASEGYFASENRQSVQQPQMIWSMPQAQQAPVYQQPQQVQQPMQQAPVYQQPQPMAQQPVYQQPAPQQAPVQQPQPQVQFTAGAWQMPSMQPEPTWTPYNVQAQTVSTQAPQTTPLFVPQFPQPAQTAWTIPPQPSQPVYVAQPAQPVFIQQPVMQQAPVYQQPVQQQPIQQPVSQPQQMAQVPVQQPQQMAQAPQMPQAPVQQPQPMPQVPVYMTQPVPAQQRPLQQAPQEAVAREIPTFGQVAQQSQQMQPVPVQQPVQQAQPAQPAPVQPPQEEPADKVLEENIVAGAGVESLQPKYEEVHHVYEPDETGRYPEKFFTFNKKNEEFQQLLDQEYARIRAIKGEAPEREVKQPVQQARESLDSTAIYTKGQISGQQTAAQSFFGAPAVEPSDLTEFEKMLMSGTTDSSESITLQINQDRIREAAAQPAPLKEEPKEEPVVDTRTEHQKKMDAMAAAREAYFSSHVRNTNSYNPIQPSEFVWTTSMDKVSEPKAAQPKAEEPKWEVKEIKKEEPKQEVKQEEIKREIPEEKAPAMEEMQEILKEEPAKAEPKEEPLPEEKAEDVKPEATEKTIEIEKDFDKESELDALLDVADEEKERRGGHGFLTFILILIILAALAVGGSIGLKIFAPNAGITHTVTGIEETIRDTIDGIMNKGEKESGDEPSGGTISESGYDFNAAVKSVNVNVEKVEENLRIAYNPEKSYDVKALSSSKLVEDPAEKELICKTLVAYNSSWIDYVNGTSTECLDYLKADGAAYRSAANYDMVGQISETFKSLEVGEMRKSGDSYYVFSREAINVTSTAEDGTKKSADAVSTMIYEMVKVGESLKIVAYYSVE